MSSSANLSAETRSQLGSRACRKLRANGRIPCNVQAPEGGDHLNLHISEHEFLGARRHHVHLFDLEFDGKSEAAVVRELQWDAMGDHIVHVEFKRVQRGVETESEVELSFVGQVRDGVLTHSVTHITISSMPSLIPDSIEVNVEGLTPGTHIKAADLVLPEGVNLITSPTLEIAVVSAIREEAEPTEEGEEGEDEAEGV